MLWDDFMNWHYMSFKSSSSKSDFLSFSYIICQGKDCTWRRTTRLVKIDVVNVVHRLARDVDVAKRRC